MKFINRTPSTIILVDFSFFFCFSQSFATSHAVKCSAMHTSCTHRNNHMDKTTTTTTNFIIGGHTCHNKKHKVSHTCCRIAHSTPQRTHDGISSPCSSDRSVRGHRNSNPTARNPRNLDDRDPCKGHGAGHADPSHSLSLTLGGPPPEPTLTTACWIHPLLQRKDTWLKQIMQQLRTFLLFFYDIFKVLKACNLLGLKQ
jgi:hypothetical protein